MATRVRRCKIRLTSFDRLTQKNLLDAKISEKSVIEAELSPILSQISFLWQRGSLVIEFLWHHSISQSWKPPSRRKHRGDISNTSWGI